jgi:hypothetical protein
VLSFDHCTAAGGPDSVSMFGAPKPSIPATIDPVCATRSAWSKVVKSLFGVWTSRVTPASTAATIAGLLTACTLTCTPTLRASSTIALSTSISACGGPGSGVRPISPVCLTPLAASACTAARASAGVWRRLICPDGMIRGPMNSPLSMPSRSAMF